MQQRHNHALHFCVTGVAFLDLNKQELSGQLVSRCTARSPSEEQQKGKSVLQVD